MTNGEKLQQAANLVNEVLADLDVSEASCSCCGLNRKTNMHDFRASQELFACVNKLEKWSETITGRAVRPNPRSET